MSNNIFDTSPLPHSNRGINRGMHMNHRGAVRGMKHMNARGNPRGAGGSRGGPQSTRGFPGGFRGSRGGGGMTRVGPPHARGRGRF